MAAIETFTYAPGSTVEVIVSQPVSGDVVVETTEFGNVWVRRTIIAIGKSRGGYEIAYGGRYGWYPEGNVRNVRRA